MTPAMSAVRNKVYRCIERGPVPKRVIVDAIIAAKLHLAEHKRRKMAGVPGEPRETAEVLVDRALQSLRRDDHIKLTKSGWVLA